MGKFHIRIVGGWCGNRMAMVRDHLSQLLSDQGYAVKIDEQSIWENYAPPHQADLILQLIPAFTQDELGKPCILVRPFLKDLNHRETLEKVFEAVKGYYDQSPPSPVPLEAQAR